MPHPVSTSVAVVVALQGCASQGVGVADLDPELPPTTPLRFSNPSPPHSCYPQPALTFPFSPPRRASTLPSTLPSPPPTSSHPPSPQLATFRETYSKVCEQCFAKYPPVEPQPSAAIIGATIASRLLKHTVTARRWGRTRFAANVFEFVPGGRTWNLVSGFSAHSCCALAHSGCTPVPRMSA